MNHPYFLLFLATFIWAGNTIVGKLAIGELAPYSLTFFRWLMASLVLLPFAYRHVKQDWFVIKPKLGLLFLLGTLGFTLFNIPLYAALQYTTAINVAIEQAAIPVFILFINFVIFRQPVSFLQVIGLLLAIMGVFITVTQGNWLYFSEHSLNRGDLLMLFASLSYAFYSFGLRWRPDIHWLSFILVLAISATLTSLPFFIWEVSHGINSKLTIKSVSLLIYTAIFASIIAQLGYAKGVSLIGANRAGFAINLIPIFGAFLAVLILGEDFRWFHFLGLILVLSGIAIAEKGRYKKPFT